MPVLGTFECFNSGSSSESLFAASGGAPSDFGRFLGGASSIVSKGPLEIGLNASFSNFLLILGSLFLDILLIYRYIKISRYCNYALCRDFMFLFSFFFHS